MIFILICKYIILLTLLYATAIIFHEIGHYSYFKLILHKDVKIRSFKIKGALIIRVGEFEDYEVLTDTQRFYIYFYGIAAGMIPFLVAFWFDLMALAIIPIYVWGCGPDIKNIWRIIR